MINAKNLPHTILLENILYDIPIFTIKLLFLTTDRRVSNVICMPFCKLSSLRMSYEFSCGPLSRQ